MVCGSGVLRTCASELRSARLGLTEPHAFDLLRVHSNDRNEKLAAVAEYVVLTGELLPLQRRRAATTPRQRCVRHLTQR